MNKRRIVLTALVGTIALAAVSVSISLAWYGSSNRLSVNYLDVGISGDDHLKVSLTNEKDSFVSHLGNEQLKDPDKEFRFEPVSTMFKSNWMNEQKDNPVFYDSSYSSTLIILQLLFYTCSPQLNFSTSLHFFKYYLLLICLDKNFFCGKNTGKCQINKRNKL